MAHFHNPSIIGASGSQSLPYSISRSLRFNSADSTYLSRTPGSAGNRKTWTWSGWVKRSGFANNKHTLFAAGTSNDCGIHFGTGDAIRVWNYSGSYTLQKVTTAVFRDPSAWYHIVVAVDTTDATAEDRCKVYVNGVRQTSFSTNTIPSQNADLEINTTVAHGVGYSASYGYLDGYLADIYFLDGTATTPSTFAETDAITGQWVPKTPTSISYGTNGFRLTFSDNSGTTSTTLGKDAAGSNNFTPNNFSVASGSGNDSLVDSPTSYGTDTGAGGQVRGNYCTWNPLDTIGGNTFSNGNLDIQTVTAAYGTCRGTIGVSSGKWYWEIDVLDETGGGQIGIIDSVSPLPSEPYLAARGYVYFDFGSKGNNSSQASYGASYTTGDLIGVALDLDAGTLAFYKNGSSQGTAYSSLPSGTVFFPVIADYQSANSSKFALNAGQRSFAYTAPSGFKALCDTNLTAPTIAKPADYFDALLWTGNSTNGRAITGLAFQPEFVWIKRRSASYGHLLHDAVRGFDSGWAKQLSTDSTAAEAVGALNGISSFDTGGFTLGVDGGVNFSGSTYVGWCWDAAGSNSTNTQGSITSTVRANATAGFSIVTYTGNGTSGATIGHGCNAKPGFVIVKSRSGGGASYYWICYHSSLGATKALELDATDAAFSAPGAWNNTEPTSSVFSVASNAVNNGNGSTYVAYCFAPVAGYSAAISWTGNGSSDGPFVFCGFRPKLILWHGGDYATHWNMYDSVRDIYNVSNKFLGANLSIAEDTTVSAVDILSNGFKIRSSAAQGNQSGQTYIGFAWAESPFQYARAR